MFAIIKHQLIDGLRDSRFLFMAALVLIAFAANGIIYAERYNLAMEDWYESIADTTRMLETRAGNLQEISNYPQQMVKHPSSLAFIAEGGENKIPNTVLVNAFIFRTSDLSNRGNEMFPLIPTVDWVFIIGTIMTLLALLLSFGSVCGEKRDGTLGLTLSYPVSRLKLFLGKYLGILLVVVITLLVGVLINLSILLFYEALPATEHAAITIGWAILVSILCLSFMLLAGIAVSSMVWRPAVALVILMIFWLLSIIAIPGIARLVGENGISVPNSFDIRKETEAKRDEIFRSAPDRTFNWSSDPAYRFTKDAQNRAKYTEALTAVGQRINDQAQAARIRQAEFIQILSSVSPSGLLAGALESLSGTGTSGYKAFRETARKYHRQLYSFTVERDRTDPESPHNIYSWGTGSDTGTFSTRPVELNSFPRSHTLWRPGGLYREQNLPAWQLLFFAMANLAAAVVAFLFMARYDPR